MEYKISVIIPVYNVEKYIDDCMKSILHQTLSEVEIICVDDGGTDSSISIIKKYQEKHKNISIISYGENRGQAFARNRGMLAANGEYVYYVDADDYLHDQDVLEDLYNEAVKSKLDFICFDAESYIEEGVSDTIHSFSMNRLGSAITDGKTAILSCVKHDQFRPVIWQELWKRSFLLDNNLLFEEDTSPHEDLLFVLEAFVKGERVKYIPRICYVYRVRQGSSTSGKYSVKRLVAHTLCYIKGIKFLQDNRLFDNKMLPVFVEYMNHAKRIIKKEAIGLIKEGTDLSNLFDDNPEYKFYFTLLLVEDFPYLKEPLRPEQYQRLKNAENIIVYGAGNVGQSVVDLLDKFGIDHYQIAVTNKIDMKHMREYQIYNLSDLREYADKSLVIVANMQSKVEMKEYALNQGFTNFLVI